MVNIYPHLLRYWDGNDYRYYYSSGHLLSHTLRQQINNADIEFCKSCKNNAPCEIGLCPLSPFYMMKDKEETHVFFPYPIHEKLYVKARNARLPYNRIEGFSFFNNEITYESIKSKLPSIFNKVDDYLTKTMFAFYNVENNSLWINWKENELVDSEIFRKITLDLENLQSSENIPQIAELQCNFGKNAVVFSDKSDKSVGGMSREVIKQENKDRVSLENRLEQVEKKLKQQEERIKELEIEIEKRKCFFQRMFC